MTTKQNSPAINAPKNSRLPANDLRGWLDLSAQAKESRLNRRQKRSWKRGRK